MVLVAGAGDDPELLRSSERGVNRGGQGDRNELVGLAVDNDGRTGDLPRRLERVESRERKSGAPRRERHPETRRERDEGAGKARGAGDVLRRHRRKVGERRPEPEGADARVVRRDVERDERPVRRAVESEPARADAEAPLGLGDEEGDVALLAKSVGDPPPARRGVGPQLGDDDVVADPEGADGVAPPFRGEAPLAVQKEKGGPASGRAGRREVGHEAGGLGGIAVVLEGLDEAARPGGLAEGRQERGLESRPVRAVPGRVGHEARRGEKERRERAQDGPEAAALGEAAAPRR